MATHRLSILNSSLNFDTGVTISVLSSELTLTNAKKPMIIVMPYPQGADLGIEGIFEIPQNYVGTPVLVIHCVIDGTPANTLAFGLTQICVGESDTRDVAYEAEDLVNNSTWTGYADEDGVKLEITITPTATYAAGKFVYWRLYRDDNVDTTAYNVLLENVSFQYADA